jgi:hypothetical protein
VFVTSWKSTAAEPSAESSCLAPETPRSNRDDSSPCPITLFGAYTGVIIQKTASPVTNGRILLRHPTAFLLRTMDPRSPIRASHPRSLRAKLIQIGATGACAAQEIHLPGITLILSWPKRILPDFPLQAVAALTREATCGWRIPILVGNLALRRACSRARPALCFPAMRDLFTANRQSRSQRRFEQARTEGGEQLARRSETSGSPVFRRKLEFATHRFLPSWLGRSCEGSRGRKGGCA